MVSVCTVLFVPPCSISDVLYVFHPGLYLLFYLSSPCSVSAILLVFHYVLCLLSCMSPTCSISTTLFVFHPVLYVPSCIRQVHHVLCLLFHVSLVHYVLYHWSPNLLLFLQSVAVQVGTRICTRRSPGLVLVTTVLFQPRSISTLLYVCVFYPIFCIRHSVFYICHVLPN